MHIISMHTDEEHSPSTNVLLSQHFIFIHHVPPGSSSQMDLNGHTESPVRGLIALLFLQGITLCLQSISLKHMLFTENICEVLQVFVSCREQNFTFARWLQKKYSRYKWNKNDLRYPFCSLIVYKVDLSSLILYIPFCFTSISDLL